MINSKKTQKEIRAQWKIDGVDWIYEYQNTFKKFKKTTSLFLKEHFYFQYLFEQDDGDNINE